VTASVETPKYYQLHWPIIVALRELGDSATIEELNSRVITDGGYTEEQQAVLHNDGPNTISISCASSKAEIL
jgi:restriction system protein